MNFERYVSRSLLRWRQLKEIHPKEEDSIFYYHSPEDRIVLSHALFWTMTLPQNFKQSQHTGQVKTIKKIDYGTEN